MHSGSLPFLHAHTLELSAKAACYQLGVSLASVKNGHDIIRIYGLLKSSLPNLNSAIPTGSHLTNYKKIWFPSNAPVSNVQLPPPDELDNLELAYFVDNVMNLKYGFTKQLIQVSSLAIAYKEVNSKFLALFRICRDTYADTDLNERLKGKIFGLFGRTIETEKKIYALLQI
jgi:Txe/YoeB family toxin of Txe-Axe toxin-antitoxin module